MELQRESAPGIVQLSTFIYWTLWALHWAAQKETTYMGKSCTVYRGQSKVKMDKSDQVSPKISAFPPKVAIFPQ